MTVLGEKPSWGFWHEESTNDKDHTENDLECNGESPCEFLWTVLGTEINPVGNTCAKSNDTSLNANQETAVGGTGTLSLPRRNSRGVLSEKVLVCKTCKEVFKETYHSVSNTSNGATNNKLCSSIASKDGSDLNNNTDNHDNSTSHDLENMSVSCCFLHGAGYIRPFCVRGGHHTQE